VQELRIVGRDGELTDVREFVTRGTQGVATSEAAALLIAGEPGLGKTTVWEAGVAAARAAGATVLMAQPAENDIRRSFSGLADLLRAVSADELDRLPSPQRRALDVALLRAEPAVGADDRAIGPAVLGVMRGLAERAPVVIAIDDLQWLDRSTADAVAFAARRVDVDHVRLLLARRSGMVTDFERDLRDVRMNRIDLVPLSLGATRRLILDRLGLELPRRRLRDLYAHSGGNPLFALELAPLTAEGVDGAGASNEPPAVLDEVLGTRLAGLPQTMQDVLLAASLAPPSTPGELSAVFGPQAIQDAAGEGLLILDERAVRVGHPLMASVALGRSSRQARRSLHGMLGAVIEDPDRRLRHRASAMSEPDHDLAMALQQAGDRSAVRGAVEDAADLAAEALRLTPLTDPARDDRLVTLGERLMLSGEHSRTIEMVSQALPGMAPGSARARARLLLVEARFHDARSTVPAIHAELDAALADAPSDERLVAMVTARRAHHLAVGRVESIRTAAADARRALDQSVGRFPDAAADAAWALAWAQHLRGRSTADLRPLIAGAAAGTPDLFRGLERIQAEDLLVRGHVTEARVSLERLLALADERGETWSFVAIRLQLIELELRAGRWDRAAAMLDDWIESPERELTTQSAYTRCRSFLAGGRGDAAEAERWANDALRYSEERGLGWDRLESLRARGLALLLAGRPAEAREALGAVWSHTRRVGVLDPGAFPVAADLVEALVETGRRDAARSIARSLIRFGRRCNHPWAAAMGHRSLALVEVTSGDVSAAGRSWEAAARLGELGLPFDQARATLALGRAQRRIRQWGGARRALTAARAGFEVIGSTGWADLAAAELERVGGRAPAVAGSLTATEDRVTRLAADGLSNKEIAEALSISIDTVERHLSNAYAKLGVQSRSQLARRIGAASPD
jgi:DNA-binding CsgD family transcriptional regulator